MKNKFILSIGLLLITLSFNINADDHKNDTNSFPGLVSTEVFELGNGMDMHVERRKTCNQGTVAKHFHPAAGTLVYVLDGKSQSKSSGKWKTYSNGDYWFERSDWVHGGETDAPDLGDVCSDILVIRVSESGKEHTVFIK
tara:strand:- start:53 stop:472 length:420 start_codon:yes stop_codon:yes gene_type:complete